LEMAMDVSLVGNRAINAKATTYPGQCPNASPTSRRRTSTWVP
jgi:hypothetical protein